jgi:Calpain family cysteine protease
MQDRLRQARPDPAPWAAQQRQVRFAPEAGGQLFSGGANANDVVQGQNGSRYLGDCWLMSALAAIAKTQPQVLEQAITDHGDGHYTVRLHRQERDGSITAEDVTVDADIPRTADGRDAYAQRQDPKELWVVIIEKAFASWKGGYGALDGGVPSDALTALTGKPTQTTFTKGGDAAGVQKALTDGKRGNSPMVAASRGDIDLKTTGVVPGHGHTILDVTEENGQTMVTVRDPFARYEPGGNGPKDGVFKLPLQEFMARFQYFTAGAAGPGAGEQGPAGPASP